MGGHSVIELHVARLAQLFNSMDASPFRDRDIDPDAEEFIESWAAELPRVARPALLVHLDRAPGTAQEEELLGDALRKYFSRRAAAVRQSLKHLFRTGRLSLLIGLAFLGCTVLASSVIDQVFHPSGTAQLLKDSLTIGGWVALWRPLEIFLYDWWPIFRRAQLMDRLATMPVQIRYSTEVPSEDWKADWPATEQRPRMLAA